MKKIIILTVIVLAISGCKSSLDSVTVERDSFGVGTIRTICLDGVEYYSYGKGYRGGLSVKIDRETLMPSICNGK